MKRTARRPEEPDEGNAEPSASQGELSSSKAKDNVEELTALVKALIERQDDREKKHEKDKLLQEQRWEAMQRQFQQIQQQQKTSEPHELEVQGQNEPSCEYGESDSDDDGPDPGGYSYKPQREPKLPILTPEDDIEHFLITFERMAKVCRWPKEEWAVRLVPLLTGKARSAFVQMDIRHSNKYGRVKEAILSKYEITDETYRRRFRSLKLEPDETPRELYVRLKDLLNRWLQPEKSSQEDVWEKLILEQFLRMVNPELEIWIRERDPDSAEEAARLAEAFLSARKGPRAGYFGREPRFTQPMPRPAAVPLMERRGRTTPVLVNGQKVEALLDSGCFQSVVLSSLVPEERRSRETTPLTCIHGDEHTYPTAEVYITVGGQTYLLNVALAENLPFDVILGNDIPTLLDLMSQSNVLEGEKVCNPVTEKPTVEPVNSVNVLTRAQKAKANFEELPFWEEEFEALPGKARKPKAKRRKEKFAGSPKEESQCSKPLSPVEFEIPTDIGALQKQDPSLKPWLEKASGQQGENKCLDETKYVIKNDILYQVNDKTEALALPHKFRQKVMELGHSIPWAGHMAFQKTLRRIGSRFAWPGIVGVAKEILTDCGTNFMSKLLKQVYQLLGVKGIRTTPYHPQTDGLVERYNKTLKHMLRKFVCDTGADWDQWLPYLLFAYREVPQASTGFSPFELLYGRQVRGPLDLLRDYWEQTETEGDNIIAYVVKMRERLEAMAALAQENLKEAQKQQKTWFDQKAKERVFSQDKRQKKHQVFHVNLLKEFHVRQEPAQQLLVRAVQDEETTEKYFPTSANEPAGLDLSHLSPSQQEDIQPLLDPSLFQETPGFTSLVQHKIRLKKDAPVRQRSYRIPERLVPVLQKEIMLMLELGIIEVSSSEWCSPSCWYPKKMALCDSA
ncbi:hypothetical protein WMY93_024969 [Mugilogobius chulae]|uniref:Integrase catalytic domain-containing protein n=1 Tax=Mugilogobius chulae TaxID=88201 RepID=A0AAW0ND34_9GOBI